jgi:hypothetical protein
MSGQSAAQRRVQPPAPGERIGKWVLVSKCLRSCRAPRAARVGWKRVLGGPPVGVSGRDLDVGISADTSIERD